MFYKKKGKPEIDEITLKCKCNGKMKRVEEVLDVWFDSGVSSWAALRNYGSKVSFEKFWPADLNVEGKDQVRGWWNSQFILSQIRFGKKPFENILVHGMILDLGKKKMSKSLGNIVSPQGIIDRYGRDYMRYYFAKHYKGDDFAFNENEIKDIQNYKKYFDKKVDYSLDLTLDMQGMMDMENMHSGMQNMPCHQMPDGSMMGD